MNNKEEICGALTGHDVRVNYFDVLIPIGSGMFMPESNNMTQFMDDDAELVAVFPDTDGLSAASSFANKRTASVQCKIQTFQKTSQLKRAFGKEISFKSFSFSS
jgi:hypothetical protein